MKPIRLTYLPPALRTVCFQPAVDRRAEQVAVSDGAMHVWQHT